MSQDFCSKQYLSTLNKVDKGSDTGEQWLPYIQWFNHN